MADLVRGTCPYCDASLIYHRITWGVAGSINGKFLPLFCSACHSISLISRESSTVFPLKKEWVAMIESNAQFMEVINQARGINPPNRLILRTAEEFYQENPNFFLPDEKIM